MTSIRRYVPFLLQIILFANNARGTKEAINHEWNTGERLYSLKQNLNISNVISEILQFHLTESDDCSSELSAITSGLTNLEEWAIKSESIYL